MPPKSSKQPKLPKPPNLGICSRILRPMQKYKNICWFLAVIVIMFYSQRSRRVIMEASKTWDGRGKTSIERIIFSLFKNLLYERYLIAGYYPANGEEYNTFNEATFVEILQRLHEMNSKEFPYNPDDNKGYHLDFYIYKLYNLLGVDCKMFDYEPTPEYAHQLYYSSVNKEFDRNIDISSLYNTKPHIPGLPPYILNLKVGVYKDDGHAPSILIITRNPVLIPFANNKIVDEDVTKELSSMKDKITYNGSEYILDSVYLVNANRTGSINHAIVGMTCKQKKFIFNGEPVKYRENFPCVLIPHNWNIRKDRDFYLSDNDCILHSVPKTEDEFRYNFSESERRFIYVRKNASRDTSASRESDVEKYHKELRDFRRLDKQRETTRLEEEIEKAKLRFQSDVEKNQDQRDKQGEAVRLEEVKVRKPNISQFARLMTPLSRLIPSLGNREGIETARLLQEEEQRKKEAISRLLQEEEQRKKEAISRERKEEEQRKKEAISRERKEQMKLFEEEERKKIEAVRLSDELSAFMAKLKLDDRGEPKRKRNSGSNSNSSPKLIKKQDRRASPQKAKTITLTKRKRYIRNTMI